MREALSMASVRGVAAATLLLAVLGPALPASGAEAPRYWSVATADSLMKRHPDFTKAYWRPWTYVHGYVLYGFERLWKQTGDPRYFDYMKAYVDRWVLPDGTIPVFNGGSLDDFMTGNIVVALYEHTREERYRKAAVEMRRYFDDYPRNRDGGFWHGRRTTGQMWIDGVFMGQMFLTRYGKSIGESEYAFDEATRQITLYAGHARKGTSGLFYHGWSESPETRWADLRTGLSPEVWSEGLGWYALLLAETLPLLPADHPRRAEVLDIFVNLVAGLRRTQEPSTGRWFQVVDKGDHPDNWTDTSGSAMFVYAIQRAIELGYVDAATYRPVVEKGYRGLVDKATIDADGLVTVTGACDGLGVQRTFYDYLHYPQKANAKEAVAGFLWATAIVEKPGSSR